MPAQMKEDIYNANKSLCIAFTPCLGWGWVCSDVSPYAVNGIRPWK